MENLLFRETEIDNLEKAVTRTLFLADRLTIIGISGKAGVGKSILTNHVLSQVEQNDGSILRLSVNGSSTAHRDDFFALIDKLTLARVERSQNSNEAFPGMRKVVRKHAAFATAVSDEMDRKNLDQTLKETMLAMIRAGRYANKLVPHTKKFVNFEALEKSGDSKRTPEKELTSLASFATREVRFLPSPIQNALGITFRNELRRDPYGLAARALLDDLRRLVFDPELCDPEHKSGSEKRFRRVVIVIDDFETLGACLSDFLFSSLLPLAKDEDFGTVLIVVGRDDLSQTLSPSIYNQYQRSIKAEVSLEPFNRDQTISFLADNGIVGPQSEDIFDWSRGNPYLLSLRRRSKHNLNASREYYLRGTQWMKESFCNVEACNYGGTKFDMVNPDETMSTDYILPGVPNKRLVFAALNRDSAIVVYERGGYANLLRTTILDFRDGKTWDTTLNSYSIRNLPALRVALSQEKYGMADGK